MIRKAREGDIVKIMELTQACSQHLIGLRIFQWNENYPTMETFEKDIRKEELYVYEIDEKIIGCIAITESKDPEYNEVNWLTPEGHSYYIHRLAVHPDEQGQGFARKMMDFAEERAVSKNKLSVRLDTFSKNLRNQRFYERRGYKKLEPVYFLNQSLDPFYCYELLL